MTTSSTTRQDGLVEPLQITIRTAARLLSYDERTIRRLITRGELQAVGRGKLRRVPVSSIHDYQRRNLCENASAPSTEGTPLCNISNP